MKIGILLHNYEVDRRNRIIYHREEMEKIQQYLPERMKTIRQILKILEKHQVEPKEVILDSSMYVYLEDGDKLPEKAYGEICQMFDQYPNLSTSTENPFFFWSTPGHAFVLMIHLGKHTCKIKKIIESKREEVYKVRYEMIGDCSGLEVSKEEGTEDVSDNDN